MIKLKDIILEQSDSYYKIDDIENPMGWHWKEIDILANMGFEQTSDSEMDLHITELDKDIQYKVFKDKTGYNLIVNGRKHVFKSFPKMMEKIDEWGSIKI